MQMEQYQNIIVINITQGKYSNHWIYCADAVNLDKIHGWDSLPVYLSALRQTITSPEVHKRGNGEDQHLYYIPMGNTVDVDKAKKIALSKFSRWKLPWSSMPDYVVRFLFRKKQDAPAEIEFFRKNSSDTAKSAYLKAYHRSVFRPYWQRKNRAVVVYWHGNSIQQITEEVNALIFEHWRNAKLTSRL